MSLLVVVVVSSKRKKLSLREPKDQIGGRHNANEKREKSRVFDRLCHCAANHELLTALKNANFRRHNHLRTYLVAHYHAVEGDGILANCSYHQIRRKNKV